MIHFTCNKCGEKLKTVHGAYLIQADRIDFCEPCDQSFRAWLKPDPAALRAPPDPLPTPKGGKP